MTVRYSMVKQDSGVVKLATDILNVFEEFKHITPDDIQWAWRKSKSSPWYGRTRVIRGEQCMFTDKKLVIAIWLKGWKSHSKAWRSLLIYHELRHIISKDEKGYHLVRHNVQDFSDIVEEYGTKWELASKFLEKLESELEDK